MFHAASWYWSVSENLARPFQNCCLLQKKNFEVIDSIPMSLILAWAKSARRTFHKNLEGYSPLLKFITATRHLFELGKRWQTMEARTRNQRTAAELGTGQITALLLVVGFVPLVNCFVYDLLRAWPLGPQVKILVSFAYFQLPGRVCGCEHWDAVSFVGTHGQDGLRRGFIGNISIRDHALLFYTFWLQETCANLQICQLYPTMLSFQANSDTVLIGTRTASACFGHLGARFPRKGCFYILQALQHTLPKETRLSLQMCFVCLIWVAAHDHCVWLRAWSMAGCVQDMSYFRKFEWSAISRSSLWGRRWHFLYPGLTCCSMLW